MKDIKVIICILMCCLLVTSCSSHSEYSSFREKYVEKYCALTKNIDDLEPIEFIKLLNDEKSSREIDELKKLLDGIKDNVPKEKQVEYGQFTKGCNDLFYIRDSYATWNEMGYEGKREVASRIIMAHIGREGWQP